MTPYMISKPYFQNSTVTGPSGLVKLHSSRSPPGMLTIHGMLTNPGSSSPRPSGLKDTMALKRVIGIILLASILCFILSLRFFLQGI